MTPRYAWAHLSCGCAYAFCGANQLAPEEGVGAHRVKSWSRINYDTLLAFRSERYQALGAEAINGLGPRASGHLLRSLYRPRSASAPTR